MIPHLDRQTYKSNILHNKWAYFKHLHNYLNSFIISIFSIDIRNDPVRKFHFNYDKSLCLADKYPEISVAPGEGQSPLNVLFDKNWDVQAFPHLHNVDSSNGKDQEREIKLTDQRYFIQRINNKELRFSKCPAYLYAAVEMASCPRIPSQPLQRA